MSFSQRKKNERITLYRRRVPAKGAPFLTSISWHKTIMNNDEKWYYDNFNNNNKVGNNNQNNKI